MKVQKTIAVAIVGFASFVPTANATPTLNSMSRRLAALSQRVRRDETTITQLHVQLAETRPAFTIRHAVSLGGGKSDIGQARCQPGETPVGGGAGWGPNGAQSSSTQDFLRYSMPFTDDAGSGWMASGFEPFGKEFQPFTIYAVCASIR